MTPREAFRNLVRLTRMKKDLHPAISDTEPCRERINEDSEGETRSAARFGWAIVVFGFGGFIVWAALAPLGNGVSMPGTVIVAGERQAVDSLRGGVVEALLVTEGQAVQSGQVIVRFDATRASTDAQSLRIRLAAARAREARLLAERDGLTTISVPVGRSIDLMLTNALARETRILQSRRAPLDNELAALQTTLIGSRAMADGLRASLAYKRSQQAILSKQLHNMRGLADEALVPRNRVLDLERSQAQLNSEIVADQGALGQIHQQIEELQLRQQQRRNSFLQEVNADLAEVQLQSEQLDQQLASAEFDLAHMSISSPSDGIVVGLAAHTVGGVIQPGARLMEIVPATAPLIVDARLPIESIDKVQTGLAVDLMFTAFDTVTTPRIEGTVTMVSADRFDDEGKGVPYYRVLIEVNGDQRHRLKVPALRPGMPVEVFVKSGERTFLNYLFKPLLDRSRTAWGDV